MIKLLRNTPVQKACFMMKCHEVQNGQERSWNWKSCLLLHLDRSSKYSHYDPRIFLRVSTWYSTDGWFVLGDMNTFGAKRGVYRAYITIDVAEPDTGKITYVFSSECNAQILP